MDSSERPRRVGAVVALKPSRYAKSRLDLPAPLRRRLAWTMAVDTLCALRAAVAEVVVVSDEPALRSRLLRAGLDVAVVGDPSPAGMNTALRHGAERLAALGCDRVLACVGDLPALRPASVGSVLAEADGVPRAFLADAAGVGTTMLVGDAGALDPRFQGRSAAAHRSSGALAVTAAVPDARRDVDTEADLLAAATLGLGPASSALLDPATGRLGRYLVVTATAYTAGDTRLAVTDAGYRLPLPASALADGLRTVRLGQRLHAVAGADPATGDRVLTAWL